MSSYDSVHKIINAFHVLKYQRQHNIIKFVILLRVPEDHNWTTNCRIEGTLMK